MLPLVAGFQHTLKTRIDFILTAPFYESSRTRSRGIAPPTPLARAPKPELIIAIANVE